MNYQNFKRFLVAGTAGAVLSINTVRGQGSFVGDGTFVNLDFESSTVSDVPSGQFGGSVPIAQALPGWAGYLGQTAQSSVLHNNQTLGSASIDLFGPHWDSAQILQGRYTVAFQSGDFSVPVSLAQTGQIPSSARALIFDSGFGGWIVSFNGTPIQIVALSQGIYGGNIGAFAGQNGELRFTSAGFDQNSLLDDIKFMSGSVPEPSIFALTVIGGLLMRIGVWRKRG